jgi:hypothetical protein
MKIWKLLSNYVEAVPKLAAISDKSKSAGSIRRGERDRQDSSWKESINENRSHTSNHISHFISVHDGFRHKNE